MHSFVVVVVVVVVVVIVEKKNRSVEGDEEEAMNEKKQNEKKLTSESSQEQFDRTNDKKARQLNAHVDTSDRFQGLSPFIVITILLGVPYRARYEKRREADGKQNEKCDMT